MATDPFANTCAFSDPLFRLSWYGNPIPDFHRPRREAFHLSWHCSCTQEAQSKGTNARVNDGGHGRETHVSTPSKAPGHLHAPVIFRDGDLAEGLH